MMDWIDRLGKCYLTPKLLLARQINKFVKTFFLYNRDLTMIDR